MLILVLIVSLLLLTWLEPSVERFMKEQVAENTEGLYVVDFEDMQLNLLSGSLTFDHLHLLPDTARHEQLRRQGKAKQLLVQVQAPSLKITGVKLLNALIRKRISIGTILLDNPQITTFYDGRATAADNGSGQSIRNIKAVRIKDFHIREASYRHVAYPDQEKVQHLARHITFRVKDMLLHSFDQPDHTRMFRADDVQLQVKDYAFRAPDSVYHLLVGSLDYSSRKGEFLLQNTQLRSDNKANLALGSGQASPAVLDIAAPLLRITGFDAVEAYRTKHLRLEQLHLESAAFAILQNPGVPSSQDTLDIGELYEKASPYLEQFSLGELRISNSELALRQQFEEAYTIHQLNNITLAIQAIQVDSSVLVSPKQNFFAEDIFFAATDYCFQHPQSPYVVQAGNLELTTSANLIKAGNLNVIGDWQKNDRLKRIGKASPMLYNIKAPRLQIIQTDLIEAFRTGNLKIGRILLEKPDISLVQDLQVPSEDLDKIMQESYREISGVVTKLQLRELSIQDATFDLHTKNQQLQLSQHLSHASVVATGLKIDSAFVYSSNKKLPVTDVVIAATDYTFKIPDNPHTFTLGSLRYSTRKQELTARTIEVHADSEQNTQLKATAKAQRRLFDVAATQLHVTGLNLIQAYNTKTLHINELVVSQPDLAIMQDNTVTSTTVEPSQQVDNSKLFGVLGAISAKTIRLEDGTFNYHDKRDEVVRTQVLEHASASVSGLHLTADRLADIEESLPVQELTLSASNYTYRSPDSLYTLRLGHLKYSSREQELVASSIDLVSDKEVHQRLKQEHREQASRNLFDLSANHFRITGLDLVRAYETGRFSMEEIRLTEPEVGILQDQNVPATNGEPQQQTADSRLNQMVEAFRVQHINITDGTFRFNMLQDTILRSQTIQNVSLALERFRLIDLAANDPLDMFYVDDIGLAVHDYVIYLPDSLYRLEVKEVRTSLNEQAVYIDSLRLVPLYDQKEFTKKLDYSDDRFEVSVPAIRLLGINLGALYNYQDILVEKVLIQDVVTEVFRDNRLPQDPNRRPPTLQKMVRDIDAYLAIDTVLVENSKLTYSEIAPNSIKPGKVVFNNIRLEALHITNDASLIREKNRTLVNGSALFMDESKLDVQFQFFLDHPEDLYTYEGTLGFMKFEAFNPVIENIIAVSAEKGHIKSAAFSVKSTGHVAEGQIDFLYEDLKIQLLNKEDKENPGFWLNAGSWLLNHLVIKSDNPAGKRELREGKIETDRNYQKSVFNHMSKALTGGITSSLMTPLVEKVAGIFISD